uniref:Uncharacterized protein n=1 Tax=Glossina palpalis gambiensis TaxID=67801 RepID=A0A1B0B5P0_9MUSC
MKMFSERLTLFAILKVLECGSAVRLQCMNFTDLIGEISCFLIITKILSEGAQKLTQNNKQHQNNVFCKNIDELKYLNACRDDNILPLYRLNIKGEKTCLVYQLMKDGSMEQCLNLKKITPITWE